MSEEKTSDFEKLGGEAGLKAHIRAFIARAHGDLIIGYLFQRVDLDRLVERETEFAARHLGGTVEYAGRPLGQVHGPLRINTGHFRRRHVLLANTLRERGVEEDIIERWLEAERPMLSLITTGKDCDE